MGQFKISHALTMKWESGYAFVKGDAGLETYCGISRRWHPNWEGWAIIDEVKLTRKLKRGEIIENAILNDMVETFYYSTLWTNVQGDKITNQSICNMLYDWTVTSNDDAAKHLQKLVGAKPDGDIGDKTIAAINAACTNDASKLVAAYKMERIIFYTELSKKGENAKFLKGWINRVNSIS